MNPVEGAAIITGNPIFPLTNPALVSVPLGFIGGWIGTLLTKESDVKKFAEVTVKANTGGFRQL
jgi:cation/acetate symporter